MASIREAIEIARQHVEAGRWALAEQIYRKVIEAEPQADAVWHLLGLTLAGQGNHAAAMTAAGRAIALRPDCGPYYRSFGQSLAALGRLPEAEACLRQALEYDPADRTTLEILGKVLARHGYPLCIPVVRIQPELDFLLLHLPPFDGMIPNGLAYVHNALRRSGVHFQTVDLNILLCHRYYQRLHMGRNPLLTAGGQEVPVELWGVSDHSVWDRDEVLDYFWIEIGDVLAQIAQQKPKAVGLSVHASNRGVNKRFVRELRAVAPDVLVVVGGYDCARREIGPCVFPDFDYMAISEADLTVGPLVAAIAQGQRPKDLPGILSRFDTPDRAWQEAPLLEDLDAVEYPRYQWTNPELYQVLCRHPNNVLPIAASRGCSWGRCRFCDECFPFRLRSPIKVADEIEEWACRGVRSFYFFESDVNGDPPALHELCTEVIRRGLRVYLCAQMRIDKHSSLEYFRHLRRAGFGRVRFGVDGWTDHTLKLQRKGYNMALVEQNLRDCTAAGIVADVNLVVGVPGETDEDIQASIANLVRCKPSFNAVEYINPLSLRCGSEYFRNADQYQIRLRVPRDTIYLRHGGCVPQDLWYSEDPYIDPQVRLERIARIYAALKANGVTVGAPAIALVEKLQQPGAYVDESGDVRLRRE